MRRGWSSPGSTGQRRAAATLALVMAATAVPITAQAGAVPLPLLAAKKKRKGKKDGLTPEQAAERRTSVQQQGQQMLAADELTAATILYDGAATTDGDPVLFLDAGDVYLEIATEEREIASAETAKMRAQTAQDILYFLLDSSSDPDWRPVANEDVSGLLARAGTLVDDADALIAEIEAEQEAVATPAASTKRPKGNGRGLKLAGAGLMGLGVAGLGVGVAGLVIGRINQRRVDDPGVYGSEFDEYDAKGRRGNVIAGVGLGVGGAALVVGTTLFVLGRRRATKAGSAPQQESPPSDEEALLRGSRSLVVVPTGRGFALAGRF